MREGAPRTGLLERLTIGDKVIASVGAVLVVVQTALTIVNSYNSGQIDEISKKVDAGIRQSAEDREKFTLYSTVSEKVFNELKAIVQDPDADFKRRIDRLTVAQAYAYTLPPGEMRTNFLTAVQTLTVGTKAAVTASLATATAGEKITLTQQQNQLQSLSTSLDQQKSEAQKLDPPRWSNYDFDIFYCSETSNAAQAKQVAEQMVKMKALDPDASGTWNVRPLSNAANVRFQANGFDVRMSSEDERDKAIALARAGNDLLQKTKVPGQFVIRKTTMSTRWYLSVFVCPS